MTSVTTRLNKDASAQSVLALRRLLNNIVGFVDCPIKDRELLLRLWHGRFPKELIQSVEVMGKYNIQLHGGGVVTNQIRIATALGNECYTALISVDEIGPASKERAALGHLQYATDILSSLRKDKDFSREVRFGDNSSLNLFIARAVLMDEGYIRSVLGDPLADDTFQWMQYCALMYQDLIIANKTIKAIFEMATTAGQIKRMVPDLLKYLPAAQQAAYENQKRASSLPFEWAPYPKRNVDIMLAQIDKGHLLQGMRKEKRADYEVEYLDCVTWAQHCKVVE